METVTPEVLKHKIYVHYIRLSGGTEGFLSEDRLRLLPQPENDFYLTLNLKKTFSVNGYVDIQKADDVFTVERQEFNPYYIEYGFFNSIKRIKITSGADLTPRMKVFIQERRPDVDFSSYEGFDISTKIETWYDQEGKNELPWNEGTALETTTDDIELSDFNEKSVISKASFFPITINS